MNPFVFEDKRPVVETKQGKLRGVTYGDVNIFMGIPYAHARRFAMPEEVRPWEGIKNAYQHGPIAMQAIDTKPFFYYRGLHMLETQSEDCQNLNIWAPKTKEGGKKPVFVWIHGGGFFGAQNVPNLWGFPVCVTTAVTNSQIIVGAFKTCGSVVSKGGVSVEATNSNEDDFVKNLMTIRAEERLALAVRRPSGFKLLSK